ncbi:MAG: hypothetical protein ACRDPM_03265 [Solirubrobacteraceae bacterium]
MSLRRILVLCAVVGMWATAASVAHAQNSISAECTYAGQTGDCTDTWYPGPVTVVWQVMPPASNISGCALQIQYVFDVDTSTVLNCTATWSGQSLKATVPLQVEISPPTATATPDRPPDANGWYNHPVTVALSGTAFSGIASCTPAQTYGGPASTSAALAGTCTDNAGKTASASFPFRYDATPPGLRVSSQQADRLAGLSWRATAGPAPLAWVQIARRPGLKRTASSVLHTGGGTRYQDRQVRNGTAYTYTITAADQAGNVTQRTVKVTPGVRLLSPRPNAHLSAPPTLRWTEIPKASYYNVQLFRGSKILSAWPTHARLKLARRWTFGGRRHKLAPGRYHWYVWPGYGARRDAHYGHPVGNATFVIR